MLAAEITREKIYARLHDELPYQTTVETTAWQEKKNGVRIEQTIFVERDSQKSIVLGKGGQMIKQLSMQARKELAEILEQPRCISSSCSSRCARTGKTTPNATARWA